MRGDAKGALAELAAQYAAGADPLAVLRDLAEVTHWVSMVRLTPEAADDPTVGPDERARGLDFAGRLSMRALTRMWQMLLKALEEVAAAPSAIMAAEMAIIRLTHVAELPSPEELVRRLGDAPVAPSLRASLRAAGGRRPGAGARAGGRRGHRRGGGAGARRRRRRRRCRRPGRSPATQRFEDVVALIRARRDVSLLVEVETGVRLVRYAPGRIEFEPAEAAPPDLAARLAQRLQLWTGARWGVAVVGSGGAATIAEVAGEGEGRPRGAGAGAPDGAGGAGGLPGRGDPRGAAGRCAGRAGGAGRRRRRRRGRRLGSDRSLLRGVRHAQGTGPAWRHGQDHEAGAGDAGAHGRRAGPPRRDRGDRRGRGRAGAGSPPTPRGR